MIDQEIIRNTITVITLLLKYFIVGWALIIVALIMVKSLSISTSIKIQRNHITAEQKFYNRKVA